VSLETRIALIGVTGALAGTLVGGLVTYKVTQEQILSERTESRRAERRDAYAKYFGGATKLWTHVFAIMEGGARPKRLSESVRSDLGTLEETVIGEYALVALVAPRQVAAVAIELNNANIDVWNALNSDPIIVADYNGVKRKMLGQQSPLTEFQDASREDLGTASG
jgi:hypothetical protein